MAPLGCITVAITPDRETAGCAGRNGGSSLKVTRSSEARPGQRQAWLVPLAGLGVFDQSACGVEVRDENVDPSPAQRGPDGPGLAGSAGHTDTSGHLHKVGRGNTHDALVERCLYGGTRNVKEPEANIADCSGVPELVLFGFGECVTALAQQG